MNDLPVWSLMPESALLEQCPQPLRKRFAVALQLMHSPQPGTLSWQHIAQQAAISPYHFHRQFSRLFGEPPARYLARQRLNTAVLKLLDFPHKAVTEIALDSGYMSSQALAKAMQRQLGVTTRQLRALAQQGTFNQLMAVLEQLGHPSAGTSLEHQLAANIVARPQWQSARWLRGKTVKDFVWQQQLDKPTALLQRLATLTPVAEAQNSLNTMTVIAGELSCAEVSGYLIDAGYYLTAQVRITSALGYFQAWRRLICLLQQQRFTIEQGGYFIEQLLHYDTESLTLSFQVPLTAAAGS